MSLFPAMTGEDTVEVGPLRFARQTHRATPDLSAAAEKVLLAYPWPRNVRERRNAIEP